MAPHEHHDDPTYDELRAALTEEFWDAKYEGSRRVWSGKPNQRLVEQVGDLTPGRALDVGCGEGADAIWLAQHGWDVTAVDVSTVALDRTAEHAIEAGVDDHIEVGVHDVMADSPHLKRRGYDLVAVHFLHVPRRDFNRVYRHIAAAVAPGGRLLVVAHHPDDVETGVRPSHGPGLLFPPEQLVGALGDGWQVEVADAPTREQETDEGAMQVRDTVVRLRLPK